MLCNKKHLIYIMELDRYYTVVILYIVFKYSSQEGKHFSLLYYDLDLAHLYNHIYIIKSNLFTNKRTITVVLHLYYTMYMFSNS